MLRLTVEFRKMQTPRSCCEKTPLSGGVGQYEAVQAVFLPSLGG
jgi:hypothetical protein